MRGKGAYFAIEVPSVQDHPRLCGEKVAGDNGLICKEGSPPPMRGKEDSLAILSPVNGITPAYAGKSKKGLPKRQRDQDHPRLCGEKAG